MYIKIKLYFCLSYILYVYSKDIIVKLNPKQIIDTLISETSMKYLTKLAQVFAKKAAETFINEIKNKERLLDDSKRAKLATEKATFKVRVPTTTEKHVPSEVSILNDEEAYKLLEKPSPDGDNLGWHSRENILEVEDRKDITKTIPVYGLMKVNGIYVRRLLGVGVI